MIFTAAAVCCRGSVLPYGAVCTKSSQTTRADHFHSLPSPSSTPPSSSLSLSHTHSRGSLLKIIPNHSCLTAACHPLYFVVRGTHCNIGQHTASATHCRGNTLLHTAKYCNTLQHTTAHCNILRHTATHATHCNTLRHTSDTPRHTATPLRTTLSAPLSVVHIVNATPTSSDNPDGGEEE